MQRRFAAIIVLLALMVVPAQAQEKSAPTLQVASAISQSAPNSAPAAYRNRAPGADQVATGWSEREPVATTGVCKGMYEIKTSATTYCSHGPDTPPAGVKITDEPQVAPNADRQPNSVICDGDGVSGYRVQVLYVRAADVGDRYGQYANSIRVWASDMDDLYYASAQETGGARRVRFVTNGCQIVVDNVVVGADDDDDFGRTIDAVKAKGYNRTDRKYLMFVDANVLCGIGTMYSDDQAGQGNWNNGGPSYSRVDAGCWGGFVAAHELMHNLGGVQRSAPHSTPYGHCWDEGDIMCYKDGPDAPEMRDICGAGHENRFDCNHDDYYHTNPPAGSYLATRWNAANNRFLIVGGGGSGPGAGYYRIVNKATNKCLDVAGVSTTSGAAITQWTCLGDNQLNQQWRFQATDSGYYVLVARHSNKAIDVDNWSTVNGGKLLQWDNHAGANQQWLAVDMGNGYYSFVSRHSGLAMDVPGCRNTDGLQLQQWQRFNNDCQAFRLERIPGTLTNPDEVTR